MDEKLSTVGPVVNLVRQTRIRPFVFGIFCIALLIVSFRMISPAILVGPEKEGFWVWSFGTLVTMIFGWLLIAAICRCFQATLSNYYIRGGEQGLSIAVPIGHKLSVFAPFYLVLKKDFYWKDLGNVEVEVDEDGHFLSEISLIMEVEGKEYRVKNLPFVEGVELIESILDDGKSFSKENFKLQEFYDEITADFKIAVATNSFSTVWFRVIGLSLIGFFVYVAVNHSDSTTLVIGTMIAVSGFAFLPFIIGALLEVNWQQPKVLMVIRLLTFASGCACPLLMVFGGQMKLVSKDLIMILLPCAFLMNWTMPVILAKKLGRSGSLWMLLAIVTSGISNLILSVQEKE